MFKLKYDSLDRLFSIVVRTRDGYTCQFCGKKAPKYKIDAAHCFTRGRKLTRWDLDNAVACCVQCHRFGPDAIDKNETEKKKWFKKRLGEKKFTMLEWKFHNPGKFLKPDKKAIKTVLTAELKRLQGDEDPYGEILGKH